jgi:hypothetical protein
MQHFPEAHNIVAVPFYRVHAEVPRSPALAFEAQFAYRIASASRGKVEPNSGWWLADSG